MANIRRVEPSRQLKSYDPFQSPFDDFFRGLFVHPSMTNFLLVDFGRDAAPVEAIGDCTGHQSERPL